MTERDLAAYYDQEGLERFERDLAPGRVEARSRFLVEHGKPGMRSLEIGCGPGRDLAAFVEAGIDACGIDLSTVFAGLAVASGAHLANATARALPFADDTFDIVWSMSVLMHLADDVIVGALHEIRRVLVPGGVACLGVWGENDVPRILEGKYGPRFFANRSEVSWRPLLGEIGVVEQYEVWDTEGDGFTYQWAVVRHTL